MFKGKQGTHWSRVGSRSKDEGRGKGRNGGKSQVERHEQGHKDKWTAMLHSQPMTYFGF